MLKGIPKVLSPELLKVLSEMGHGDKIVITDANFPAHSSKAKHILRADGITATVMLDAILSLFPVDTFVAKPIGMMQVVQGDDYTPEIWQEFYEILDKHAVEQSKIYYFERFEFYKESDTAYAVLLTGEEARYANMILTKGVL